MKDFLACIRADLSGADFSFHYLASTNFSWANLKGASFSQSILEGVDFSRANLTGASSYAAHGVGQNFYGANLYGTDFSTWDFTDSKADRETEWPEVFDPVAAGVIFD